MVAINIELLTILVLRKIKSHFQPGRLFYMSLRGSMTDPPPSTMAASEAAAPSGVTQQVRNAPPTAPPPSGEKNLFTRELDLTLRAFFPIPTAPTKFNPIQAMTSLLRTMIKDEPSLVLRTPSNDQQIIVTSSSLPT